jgi:hypothetical protein
MGHSARFDYVEPTVSLAVALDVAHREPGIHKGRYADVGFIDFFAGNQACEKGRCREPDYTVGMRGFFSE